MSLLSWLLIALLVCAAVVSGLLILGEWLFFRNDEVEEETREEYIARRAQG